jgi:hypothetical protein
LGKEVTSTGFASLASLEHLEEFLFSDHFQWDPFRSKNRRYYKMCLRLLPWLHFSGYRLKFTKKIYNHPSFYYFDKCRYLKRRMPSQLGLRQISLIEPSRMPVGIALPNLETLYLHGPTNDFQLGTGSLSSLTELFFSQTKQIPMEKILSVLGHQLRKLSVKVTDTLYLDSVFRMCPNLQVFYVPECPVDYIGLKDELLNCNLHSMTELCFVEEYYDHDRSLLKTDHLLQILQAAPNLQIFHMHTHIFSEQDGKDFCLALEQHLILQKLEQFTFSYDLPETEPDELSEHIGRAVINSIISLCPRLSTVNVKNMCF